MNNRGQVADDSFMIPFALSAIVGLVLYSAIGGPPDYSPLAIMGAGVIGAVAYEMYRSRTGKDPDRWKAEGGSSE